MNIRTLGVALTMFLLLASLSACAHQGVPLKARPSDINMNTDSYVGKRVEVTGLLRDFHSYCLTFVNWREATEIVKHLDNVEITVVGEVVTIDTSQAIDFGSCSLPTGIWVDIGDLRKRYSSRS